MIDKLIDIDRSNLSSLNFSYENIYLLFIIYYLLFIYEKPPNYIQDLNCIQELNYYIYVEKYIYKIYLLLHIKIYSKKKLLKNNIHLNIYYKYINI